MYSELVKSLRNVADNSHYTSPELLSDAADAIENTSKAYQMMAEAYEAQVTKQEWISVTERLPENKRETYLILTDGRYECDARWTDNVYGLGQSDRWGWCVFDIPQYSKVTHWMYRPEPPKEETE